MKTHITNKLHFTNNFIFFRSSCCFSVSFHFDVDILYLSIWSNGNLQQKKDTGGST